MLLRTIWILIGCGLALTFGAFGLSSLAERERRAARLAFVLAALGLVIGLGFSLLSEPISRIGLIIVGIMGVLFAVLFILPIGRVSIGPEQPQSRFDERDIMFARARLQPGTARYESYYQRHPEYRASDDKNRARAGLLSANARLANPIAFAAAGASFSLTEALHEAVDGPVAEGRLSVDAGAISRTLKELARFYGACDVGITRLHPNHVYSHIGRGSGEYGAPIELPHGYAIAITVEMDHKMMAASPTAPVVMESARQYGEAARVAVPLAAFIRRLGYSARAHIDGNYRVITPLVARDAGLGEIGRMGILMTPRQGPRVRLAVVTTDMPLQPDPRRPQPAMIDFCNICQKCAENCPSNSIPTDDRRLSNGALRWRINPDTCFAYWNVIGTDCGRCMAVCPFSHPDTPFHNVIRWGIQRSGFFRRLALWLDDLFYGRQPARRLTVWNAWDTRSVDR